MKKAFIFVSTLVLLFAIGCEPEEEQEVQMASFEKIDVITGIQLTDLNGAPIGNWLFPNEKTTEILAYPNPVGSTVFVSSQQELNNIWIIPVSCENENLDSDIPTLSESLDFDIAEIENRQVITIAAPSLSNNSIAIDLSDLDNGFYRIFFETNTGELFWKNIFRTDDAVMPHNGWNDLLHSACN